MQDFMYVVLWETMKCIGTLKGVSVSASSFFFFSSFFCVIEIAQEVKIPFQLLSQILNRFGNFL